MRRTAITISVGFENLPEKECDFIEKCRNAGFVANVRTAFNFGIASIAPSVAIRIFVRFKLNFFGQNGCTANGTFLMTCSDRRAG